MACEPSTLLDSAKCFQCLTPKQLEAIQANLLCQIAAASGGGSAFYGDMYLDNGSSLVVLGSANAYSAVTGFSAGEQENITVDLAAATERLIINVGSAGVYLCTLTISQKVATAAAFTTAVFVDNVRSAKLTIQILDATTNAIQSGAAAALLTLVAGSFLDVRVACAVPSGVYTMVQAALSLHLVRKI